MSKRKKEEEKKTNHKLVSDAFIFGHQAQFIADNNRPQKLGGAEGRRASEKKSVCPFSSEKSE